MLVYRNNQLEDEHFGRGWKQHWVQGDVLDHRVVRVFL